MASYTLTVIAAGEKKTLPADEDKTVYQILSEYHLPVQKAACGGRGRCGNCTVKAQGVLRSLRTGEEKEVNGPIRACQHFPAGDVTVWVKAT